jgi:hypothetical protein
MVETGAGGPFVYFLAEAGIYAFSRNMAIFGGSLAKVGQKGFLTRCTGQLARCAYLEMLNVPLEEAVEAKARFCPQCDRHIDILSARYSLPVLSFSDFWTSDDALSAESCLESFLTEEPLHAVYDGVPVGKLAYKNIILATKDDTPVFTGKRGWLFAEYVKTAIQSVIITQGIIRSVRPAAFVYGQSYAVELASRVVCRHSGISVSHHSAAGLNVYDFGRIIVRSQSYVQHATNLPRVWSVCSHIPLTQEQVRSCWDDVYCRNHLSGVHIYSPNKGGNLEAVRERFSLAPHRKTLVLYTSSPDERNAAKVEAEMDGFVLNCVNLFADQAEWIESGCAFVAADENLQLVIRIHPRQGCDKRQDTASPHLSILESHFTVLPERCHIVWPQDPLSSYDLAELADLVLIGWTSMGRELARIGVPVIATMRNWNYPDDDFIQIPVTQAEYFERISLTLRRRHTLRMQVKAIRFHHVAMELPTLDLREDIGSDLPDIHHDAKLFVGEKNAHLLRDLFLEKFDLAEENLRAFLTSQANASEEDEVRAVAREICYFIHYSFFPPTHAQAVFLPAWKNFLKSLIKQFVPVWLAHKGKAYLHAAKHLLLPKIKPVGKKKIFPRPDFVFRLAPVSGSLEQYREMTSCDAMLCIIVRGVDTLFYIKDGIVKERASGMLTKLIDLFEELPLSVKNDFAFVRESCRSVNLGIFFALSLKLYISTAAKAALAASCQGRFLSFSGYDGRRLLQS